MYYVQFSSLRAAEYASPQLFDQRVRKWLLLREGENTYLLEQLARTLQQCNTTGKTPAERMFAVEDDNQVVAAGMLLPGGCFCMTWATEEISETLIRCMADARCHVTSVYAHGHVSVRFSELWAQLRGQVVDCGRSERVYQINRVTFTPPAAGRLELATVADRPLLLQWFRGFIGEANFESNHTSPEPLVDETLAHNSVYLWKDPGPVAMASWIASTESANSINLVYVPPYLRGKGYAKAVSAALASRILAAGKRRCFILTDTHDELTNHLYQSIGARAVCELLRCTLRDKTPATQTPQPSQTGRLNVTDRFTAA